MLGGISMTSESISVRNLEMPEAGLRSHLSPAFENLKKHNTRNNSKTEIKNVLFIAMKVPNARQGGVCISQGSLEKQNRLDIYRRDLL